VPDSLSSFDPSYLYDRHYEKSVRAEGCLLAVGGSCLLLKVCWNSSSRIFAGGFGMNTGAAGPTLYCCCFALWRRGWGFFFACLLCPDGSFKVSFSLQPLNLTNVSVCYSLWIRRPSRSAVPHLHLCPKHILLPLCFAAPSPLPLPFVSLNTKRLSHISQPLDSAADLGPPLLPLALA
jgi:hypothetical protein